MSMTKPVGVTRALRCALLGAASAAAIGAAGSVAARDVTEQMLLNAANDPANWITKFPRKSGHLDLTMGVSDGTTYQASPSQEVQH
jgi:hypothetical protein